MSQQVPGPAGPASLTAAEVECLLLGCQEGLLDYVRGHLWKSLCGTRDPQDIVQDAFVQGLESLSHFAPTGADAAIRWLKTIARNHIINEGKAGAAAKRGGGSPTVVPIPLEDDESPDCEFAEPAGKEPGPLESAISHEAAAAVHLAIGRLPPDYQKAIQMRYIDGEPIDVIARAMGRTEHTIHLLCSRAREALREQLRSMPGLE